MPDGFVFEYYAVYGDVGDGVSAGLGDDEGLISSSGDEYCSTIRSDAVADYCDAERRWCLSCDV